MKRPEEFHAKRKEIIWSMTLISELSFLDCICISLHAGNTQGMLLSILNPKEMVLAERKLSLPGEEKELRELPLKSTEEHCGILDLTMSRLFSVLISVIHRNRCNRDVWHLAPNQT